MKGFWEMTFEQLSKRIQQYWNKDHKQGIKIAKEADIWTRFELMAQVILLLL